MHFARGVEGQELWLERGRMAADSEKSSVDGKSADLDGGGKDEL